MALTSGSRLGPYEIIGPLGEGGMGEVYKALDPRLHRLVAIKVLPAAAANDTERRERFEREAHSVAALNHPSIVTIHSVEDADGVFFLTMELVEGRTLAEVLPERGLPLEQLLRIAIPVAEAISAAHQKGITHRDLKPGNIMIGEGDHVGRIKVLDFGLAKLVTAPAAEAGATGMPTAPVTGDGRILGTVAYMSPEQAEGKPIDARSDLFSLGVILYEMATGRRPFTGDTNISIISSIVKDTPKSVTELNPAVPRDLARIIRRALTKDVDRRYQSAKDLRNDLEDVKAALDSGELHAEVAGSHEASRERSGVGPYGRWAAMALASAFVVLALGGAAFMLAGRRSTDASPTAAGPSIQNLQLVPLTASGNADRPVISPDGKYVAYVQHSMAGGTPMSSVWIRQVATSGNVQILAPQRRPVLGLSVTPDGNFVDYIQQEAPLRRDLWRVSFLGGPPRKLLEQVDSAVGWSPDGRHMAFVRAYGERGSTELVVADPDGGSPRVVATRQNPAQFDSLSLTSSPDSHPAWSSDGRIIAALGRVEGPLQAQVIVVDTATGAEQALPVPGGTGSGIDWLDTGTLAANLAPEGGAMRQIWRLAYPGGTVTRLTNDLSGYHGMSVTAGRDSLVTTRVDSRVSLWVGDAVGAGMKEMVSATPSTDEFNAVVWSGDRLLFTSILGGHRTISMASASDGATQEVVSQARYPAVTPDGRTIAFESVDPARPGIWKITDGGRPVQLTPIRGTNLIATGDGLHMVFITNTTGLQSPWIIPLDGGTATQVANRFAGSPTLTVANDQTLAFVSRDEKNRSIIVICKLPDCRSPQTVMVPDSAGVGIRRWAPDGNGIAYVVGTPSNIWVQPLDDSKPPHQLSHFTDERTIADFAWSDDGQRLAIARVATTRDVVLFKGLRKSTP